MSKDLLPIVVSRRRASEMLGVDPSTLRRWQDGGLIQPIRLNKFSARGHVHYRLDDILRLTEAEEPSAPVAEAEQAKAAPRQPRRERERLNRPERWQVA